jgi:hypothetical protein
MDDARGRHKARVFRAILGIHAGNAGLLADALKQAARESDARVKESSSDAVKYEIDFLMAGPAGSATVRSGWIIERGTDRPRLATCFVKRRG